MNMISQIYIKYLIIKNFVGKDYAKIYKNPSNWKISGLLKKVTGNKKCNVLRLRAAQNQTKIIKGSGVYLSLFSIFYLS